MAAKGKAGKGKAADSQFAKESKSLAIVPSLMAQLFTREDEKELENDKIERRNAPAMLKPGDVPVWSPENPVILRAEIVRIMDSPKASIEGKLLWLRTAGGHEFTFPCTGVIRNALAPGIKTDDPKLGETLEKEVGKIIFLKRTPDRMSGEYKKPMFMFDVYTAKA